MGNIDDSNNMRQNMVLQWTRPGEGPDDYRGFARPGKVTYSAPYSTAAAGGDWYDVEDGRGGQPYICTDGEGGTAEHAGVYVGLLMGRPRSISESAAVLSQDGTPLDYSFGVNVATRVYRSATHLAETTELFWNAQMVLVDSGGGGDITIDVAMGTDFAPDGPQGQFGTWVGSIGGLTCGWVFYEAIAGGFRLTLLDGTGSPFTTALSTSDFIHIRGSVTYTWTYAT